MLRAYCWNGRRLHASLGALALALLLSASAVSADEFATPHVTVTGTATLQVVPDLMRWQLAVRTVDPASAGAAEAQGKAVAAVMAFLKQQRIVEESIQTSRIQLGDNWSDSRAGRVRDGYFAATDLSFSLTDFDRYARIWTGLAELPGVSVRAVDMDHRDRIRFQNEARVKALLAAREKAGELAAALGATLGDALFVEEEPAGGQGRFPNPSNVLAHAGEFGGLEEFLAPGAIAIQARVKAAFVLRAQD